MFNIRDCDGAWNLKMQKLTENVQKNSRILKKGDLVNYYNAYAIADLGEQVNTLGIVLGPNLLRPHVVQVAWFDSHETTMESREDPSPEIRILSRKFICPDSSAG